MIRRTTDSDARWTLRASILDGSAWSVMCATGQDNIVVFAVALGLGDAFSGLLGSLPQVIGAVLQLTTPWGVARLGSHRTWTVACSFVQAISFAPLIFAAALGHASPVLLYVVASIYWFSGMACGSSWHTFMSQAVPRRARPRFFATRMRVMTVLLILATVANGLFIEAGRRQGHALGALATLFGIALLARVISSTYLSAQVERHPMPKGFRHVGLREFIARFAHGDSGRAIAFLLAMQFGLQMSGPFLQPYLLRRLNLENEFSSYGIVMAALLVGKIIALPLWGRMAHARRVDHLLWIGGLGLIPVPALWLISDSLWVAVLVQLYTGAVLAAFEYAGFLRVFETVRDSERTSVITWYQAMSSLAVLLGSLVGAKLLALGDAHHAGYAWLFLGATAARFAAIPLLIRAASHSPAAASSPRLGPACDSA
jgi:MFS family permease